MHKTLLGAFFVLAVLIGLGHHLFVHDCELGGAMAGAHRTCSCVGVEKLISDRSAADGPRHSVCYGVVTAESCSRYRGGSSIPCDGLEFGPPD